MQLVRTRETAPIVVWLDEIGSTNNELSRRMSSEPADAWPHLAVLATDNQTAGKGRLGRVWTAPAGACLAASVVVRPGRGREFDPVGYGWIPLLAGTAMSRALTELLPGSNPAQLKWPNDVLISGAKVCGILTELQPDGSVIIGSGVNLDLTADQLPTPTSTSLVLAGATTHDADSVLATYLEHLSPLLDRLARAGGNADAAGLVADVTHSCDTIGQAVRVELPSGASPVGRAIALDAEGRLIVDTSVGDVGQPELLAVAAGDVTHLRVVMKGE
jgi:BirA family biotin operon repressor/biotin-[acetyl-CoA-carboxylase] ligase